MPAKQPRKRARKPLGGAARVVAFLEGLTVPAGFGAGKPFRVRPWQRKILQGIYDPVDAHGRRIVRSVLISLPRKNGKTGLAAGLALYHLLADGELNGQVISAARDRNQSGLIYNASKAMVQADPDLAAHVNLIESQKRIVHYASGSYYVAIAADATRAHGLSPSFAGMDEMAQWPNRNLYDAISTATGGREQPLLLTISTQSADRHSVMSELTEYGRKVNAGVIDDPSFFAAIFEAPKESDPWAEATWRAANPALGDFRSLDECRIAAARAQRIPSEESIFRLFHLNQPVEADTRFVAASDWDACDEAVDLDALDGRPCWGGLDLSSTQDLTSLVLVFPDDDAPDTYDVLCWFWTAGDTIIDRGDRDRVPYALWRDQGFLNAPPGRAIDKGAVVHTLGEVTARFDVRGIAYDRWGILELQKRLADEGIEVPLTPWGQGFRTWPRPSTRSKWGSSIANSATVVIRCCAGMPPMQLLRWIRPATANSARRRQPAVLTAWWRWRWRWASRLGPQRRRARSTCGTDPRACFSSEGAISRLAPPVSVG